MEQIDSDSHHLPTRQEIETLAWEMYLRMPNNQLDFWCRVFFGLMMTGTPGWDQRCSWFLDAADKLLPGGLDWERIGRRTAPSEAFNLGASGHGLSIDGWLRLFGFFYNLGLDIGHDAPQLDLVRWYRMGEAGRTGAFSRETGGGPCTKN